MNCDIAYLLMYSPLIFDLFPTNNNQLYSTRTNTLYISFAVSVVCIISISNARCQL